MPSLNFKAILINLKDKLDKIDAAGYVFMLHRVGEHNPDGITENENMKVSINFCNCSAAPLRMPFLCKT